MLSCSTYGALFLMRRMRRWRWKLFQIIQLFYQIMSGLTPPALASSVAVDGNAYTILEADRRDGSETLRCHYVGRTKSLGKCCVYRTGVQKPLFRCGKADCDHIAHLECYVKNVLEEPGYSVIQHKDKPSSCINMDIIHIFCG